MKTFERELGKAFRCIAALWIFAFLLSRSMNAFAEEAKYLIVPGHCVGAVCLEDAQSAIRKKLGEPNSHKSLHGKNEVDIWKSRGSRPEYLFVVYKEKKVADIHFTSSAFKTKNGVSMESNLDAVKKEFPEGRENEYTLFESGHNRLDWIVKKQGITFTFAGDKEGQLVRIAIHQPGTSKAIGYSEGEDWYWRPTP